MSAEDPMVRAVNRVADALFQQAKNTLKLAKAQERAIEIQEEALELHRQQASTSAALEHALTNAAGRRDA